MKIGDEVYVHGYVDEIRNGTIIIRNEGGYFGTALDEVMPSVQPDLESAYAEGYTAAEADFHKLRDAQPRWIPVTERRPEYGAEVLTINTDGDYEINHIIDEEDAEWFLNGVIAWRELPEPYAERKENASSR